MLKKNFLIIITIAVVAGFLGFWFYRERIFSKEILRLEILGPESSKVGEEIEYTVKYKNNGNFVLEEPKLVFQLPGNSLTEDGKFRIVQDLKDIYPGDENFVKIKTRLLGQENDLKVAKASLSYIPKNLTARYESDTTFTTKIQAVPITFDIDSPLKAEKGKDLQYSINYFSNIDYPLENLSIKIDSGTGFNFEKSDPVSLDKSEWKISTLDKGEGGRIKIIGKIAPEASNQISLSATFGMWQDDQFIPIKKAAKDIQIIEPLLFISQQINGSSNYSASLGDTLHYEIFIRNIGSTPFDDLFIISRLSGSVLDLSTLHSADGQARPNDNMIVWDSRQVPGIRRIEPQQEAKVEFDVKLKENWFPSDSERNGSAIKNHVDVLGISQEFETKVNSKLEFSQQAFYSTVNEIQNSGPMPPKAGETTTYTVVWKISNNLNDAKNIKVKTILPQGISLTSKIIPESQSANFSFDSTSREIIWSAGDLPANGQNSLSFQISFTPSLYQRGRAATLLGPAAIVGEDQFTGSAIQSASPSIDTNLPNDNGNSGKGTVQ